MHEGVEALVGLFLPCGGEVSGAHRGCEWGRPQGALDEPGVHASCEPMGGVRMPEGRDGHPQFGNASAVCGDAEGALDTRATPRGGRHRTVVVIPPGGGKEPGRIPVGFPGGVEESEGIGG